MTTKTIEQLRQENDELFAKINGQLDNIIKVFREQSDIINAALMELEQTIDTANNFVYGGDQQPEVIEDEFSPMDFVEHEFV